MTIKLVLLGVAFILVGIALAIYLPVLALCFLSNDMDAIQGLFQFLIPSLICSGLIICIVGALFQENDKGNGN